MTLVRLYGDFHNFGSAGTVTQGWRSVLSERRRLAGVFSSRQIDYPGSDPVSSGACDWGASFGLFSRIDEFAPSAGANAPIAIVSDARELGIAIAHGHKDVRVILAVHTGWLPHNLLHAVLDNNVTVLSPSRWSQSRLKAYAPDVRSDLVLHGVSSDFRPYDESGWAAVESSDLCRKFRGPGWNLLHLAESSIARKGTEELIHAVGECVRLGGDISLTCIVSSVERAKLACFVDDDPVLRKHVHVLPRLNAPPAKMRPFMACFDAIVQPSRVEGFGLAPLEAVCIGVPAIVSKGTGHLEWAFTPMGGIKRSIMPVALDDETEARFEPGLAPSVTSEEIQGSLAATYEIREEIKQEARENAKDWYQRWTWSSVLRDYVENLQERKISNDQLGSGL